QSSGPSVSLNDMHSARHQFDLSQVSDLRAKIASAAASLDSNKAVAALAELLQVASNSYAHGIFEALDPLIDAYVALARIHLKRGSLDSALANYRSTGAAIATGLATKPGDRNLLKRQME